MIPSEYQQVLFIESNGTQWIDTGLISDKPDAGYQMMFRPEKSKNWAQYFAGPKIPAELLNPPKLFQWANGSSTGRLGIESFKEGQGNIQIPDVDSKVNNIIYTKKSLKFNNEIQSEDGFNTSWGATSYYIFNGHEENTLQSSMALYSLKMWSGEELQRDFIPCYIKDTNEVGLYDLVENKFYSNSGTGSFIKGPDIITPTEPIIEGFSTSHFRRRIISMNI